MEYDFQKSEDMKKELQDKVLLISESFKDNPETIAEFLKFKTKFYNYSSRNTMLIFQQNPGAVFCNSFKAFKDLKYSVKKGEHGMKILVPTLKTYLNVNDEWIALSRATAEQKALYKQGKIQSQQNLFFKIGTVFDITQTNCPSEDYPKYLDIGYSSAQHAQLYDTLKKYCEQELKCTVLENNLNSVTLRGYYNYTTNEIAISGAFEDTTRLSILSHEMGHAIIHNSPESRQRPTVQKEFEADALSVMLHTYMGVEIAEVRERHLFESYQAMITDINYKPEMLNQSLERANQAFIQVTESINKELRPELKRTVSKELSNKSAEQNQTQSIMEKINQKPEQQNLNITTENNDYNFSQTTQQTQTAENSQQPILPNQLPDMGGFTQSM